jgi:hypothetical protein
LTCPDAGATPGAWVERWLRLALFHGQQANAWMKNIFEVVESSDGTQVPSARSVRSSSRACPSQPGFTSPGDDELI